MEKSGRTHCRVTKITIPTYPEPSAEKLPIYCENRVHQRSSGKVYPNAIVNGVIRDHKEDRDYTAIILENDFIELIILPELGGRIFAAKDKSNGYDFFYRQHVIKPALIGLLGSWVSGGAEFNWPLHHRPSTFMPVDFEIEEEAGGSVTVWLSEHEPLDRMKGMVGIRMEPDKAMFETVVKLYNRTPFAHSFLWWENIAVPVNEEYQIFFPQDVQNVYFHYKKSVTRFPAPDSMFNGIDYRNSTKDIRWHKDTRKSTSYFSARSRFDFFGGFDHGRKAGVIHIANHHVSPGKKMFTWAYNQLSQSWERALTDTDGAYAELMAGSYTDNQPDFAWIEPFEEKTFSQFWFPFKDIGEPKNANTNAALNYRLEDGHLRVQLYAVRNLIDAEIAISIHGDIQGRAKLNVQAGTVAEANFKLIKKASAEELVIRITGHDGKEIISFQTPTEPAELSPRVTPVLPSPDELNTPESLFLAGTHLQQYRDPITNPAAYWKRALEIDIEHAPSANALGVLALKEGRLAEAETWFRTAVAAQTRFNPNPRDGESYYNLGLALKWQGKLDQAYEAFYKSIWNYDSRSPGYYTIAQIDCIRGDFELARQHLQLAVEANAKNFSASYLLAAVERKLGVQGDDRASAVLKQNPLSYMAMTERLLSGAKGDEMFGKMKSDPSQTLLDVLFEYIGAGLFDDAADLAARFLKFFHEKPTSPMVRFVQAWVFAQLGKTDESEQAYADVESQSPDYCFPSRLEEMIILQNRLAHRPSARASYYLGNLLYGKSRHDEAIRCWEDALKNGEAYYAVYRNLAMGWYNAGQHSEKALEFINKAYSRKPGDSQLVFERNLLMQRLNQPFEERLRLLESESALVNSRDDLYMELIRVQNQMGNAAKAIELLKGHRFTPCEGGEHELVDLWIFAHFSLGRKAFRGGQFEKALEYFRAAQVFPENLGAGIWNESFAIPSRYYEAQCCTELGQKTQAFDIYRAIVNSGTDSFTYMYQPAFDYYRAMAFMAMGNCENGHRLLEQCLAKWDAEKRKPDYGYFKTTPFWLSYMENPATARTQHYEYLIGMAYTALGRKEQAAKAFEKVLAINSGHCWARIELDMLK